MSMPYLSILLFFTIISQYYLRGKQERARKALCVSTIGSFIQLYTYIRWKYDELFHNKSSRTCKYGEIDVYVMTFENENG